MAVEFILWMKLYCQMENIAAFIIKNVSYQLHNHFGKDLKTLLIKLKQDHNFKRKKVFFENVKNKYFKYVRTKGIKNRSLLNSYSESDEYTDDESIDSESSGCFGTALIVSSDNDSEQIDSEQTVLLDETKPSLKNMIKETIADKIESNLLETENEIENKNKDKM